MAGATKKLEDMSLEEYQRQQVADWGHYRAKEPIFVHGARAFNPGDPVPTSHVTSGLVDKSQVETVPAAEKES